MTPPMEIDSSVGRASVVHTARELRHRIRNHLEIIGLAASMLKMEVFRGDPESLQNIAIGIERLVKDTDELYFIATGGRPRWWRRAARYLFG